MGFRSVLFLPECGTSHLKAAHYNAFHGHRTLKTGASKRSKDGLLPGFWNYENLRARGCAIILQGILADFTTRCKAKRLGAGMNETHSTFRWFQLPSLRIAERFFGALSIWLIAVFLFCFWAQFDQKRPLPSCHNQSWSKPRLCHSDHLFEDLHLFKGLSMLLHPLGESPLHHVIESSLVCLCKDTHQMKQKDPPCKTLRRWRLQRADDICWERLCFEAAAGHEQTVWIHIYIYVCVCYIYVYIYIYRV